MRRVAPIEWTMAVGAAAAVAGAMAIAHRVDAPADGKAWTDGVPGAWLWLTAAVVPMLAAAAFAVVRRRRDGARLLLGTVLVVASSSAVGSALHLTDPPLRRGTLAAFGAGLDVAAVALAVAAAVTMLLPRLSRAVTAVALLAGAAAVVAFGLAGSVSGRAMPVPAVSPLQLPSLLFLGRSGDAVLLVLTFAAAGGAAFVVGMIATATPAERADLRWLWLALVAGTSAVVVIHVARLTGAVVLGDDFVAAATRVLAWATATIGVAVTIVQPAVDDAAGVVRRVAVGIGTVTALVAAGGLAWFAADVTTDDILPWAPAAAAALSVVALAPPLHDRLDRAARRWLTGEAASDAALIDGFGAAAEELGRTELLQLLATTARRAVRLRWARARTTGTHVVVATAGPGAGSEPLAETELVLAESGEELGVLECGPKRGGPLSARDRQLLAALTREAALRLRTLQLGSELAARLRRIELQAAEIDASRARIVEATDDERRRIERDLHDGVQQDLAALLGKLRRARRQVDSTPAAAALTLGDAQDDVRRTLAEVRAIAQGIHPAILDDHGLVAAITARAQRLPVPATVCVTPELAPRRFSRQLEGAAYFVVAEALANVVKHATASAVTVEVTLDGTTLEISVTDDGRGFDGADAGGAGLTNMADRASALGGHLVATAGRAGGTTVVVRLPVEPAVPS